MKTIFYIIFIIFDIGLASHYYGHMPPRTVMFGGYYGRPMEPRGYFPEGSMTFAAGDTIATNSFVGEHPNFPGSVEETTEKRRVSFEETLEDEGNSKRVPTRKPKPTNEEEESEEDTSGSWPFQTSRKGVPSYNAFFPIMIGGTPSEARRRNGDSTSESFYPGSAIAIANSFSTGKGGVATSHATSFGDPNLSTLFKNGYFNNDNNNNANKKQ